MRGPARFSQYGYWLAAAVAVAGALLASRAFDGLLWRVVPRRAALCARDAPPLVCAHGGAPRGSVHRANTPGALARAAAMGVRCVELDASLSADGVPVVLHDRDLRALLADGGAAPGAAVEAASTDYTAAELGAMGVSGLAAALDGLCAAAAAQLSLLIVDVKLPAASGPGPAAAAERFARAVGASACARAPPEVLFFSKDDVATEYLATLGAAYDSASAYVVMNGTARNLADGHHRALLGRPEGAGAAAVHWSMAVDEGVVASLQARGRRVFAWTVETVELALRLAAAGVDGIVADGALIAQMDRAVEALWTEECAR